MPMPQVDDQHSGKKIPLSPPWSGTVLYYRRFSRHSSSWLAVRNVVCCPKKTVGFYFVRITYVIPHDGQTDNSAIKFFLDLASFFDEHRHLELLVNRIVHSCQAHRYSSPISTYYESRSSLFYCPPLSHFQVAPHRPTLWFTSDHVPLSCRSHGRMHTISS